MFEFSSGYYEDYEYNIKLIPNTDDISSIMALEDIDEYYFLYEVKPQDYLRIYDRSKIAQINDLQEDSEGNTHMNLVILGLDDTTFRKYAKKIGENYDKIKDKGILIDDYEYLEEVDGERVKQESRIYKYKVGDTVSGKIR